MAPLLLVVVACFATPVAGAPAKPRGASYWVDAVRGQDSGPGSKTRPWRTLRRANRASRGATVWVAAGRYADAPTAPGVRFVGKSGRDRKVRTILSPVTLMGRATHLTGFTLAGGLRLEGGARDNRIESCRIERHLDVQGGPAAAPRDNRFVSCVASVRTFHAHNHESDDERSVPRITRLAFEGCEITVERSEGVLWRWAGVDDARIVQSTIRLVNRGSRNDDDASWKWFYVRRALIADSRIVLDHAARFGETGPFAPMWRDSTWGIRMVRTTVQALRGSMIFSPNTAGSWICTCGGHRFEDVVIRAPGTVWFYQCARKPSDRWVRSRVYAGRFEEYNTTHMPSGLSVKSYAQAR